jgi:hypothetical protein
MTEIILHIGGEKTGSTALQTALMNNAPRLYRQTGLLYPQRSLLNSGHGHFPLAAAFLDLPLRNFIGPAHYQPPDVMRWALETVIAKRRPRVVVLSAEHFSSRYGADQIAALAKLLSPWPVKIVFYVRPQEELAASAFSSALLSGLKEWFHVDGVPSGARYFDLCSIADDWAAAFGAGNLRVRSYAEAAGRGLVEDFLAEAGVSGITLEPVGRLNASISLMEAQLLHAVNQHLPSWEEAIGQNDTQAYFAAERYRRRMLDIARTIPAFAGSPPVTSIVGAEQRAIIRGRFADSNRRLGERYGIRFAEPAVTSGATNGAMPIPIDAALIQLAIAQLRIQERQIESVNWLYRRTPRAWARWLINLPKRKFGEWTSV